MPGLFGTRFLSDHRRRINGQWYYKRRSYADITFANLIVPTYSLILIVIYYSFQADIYSCVAEFGSFLLFEG